jgi:protein-S-isoprenylcysteine O-methyltransferase Ste14
MSTFLILKNIFLSLLGFGFGWVFCVSLPILISSSEFEPFPFNMGSLHLLGWTPIILGALAFLYCYWIFIFIGKGTPWPFDPPKKLIIIGLYRYVRNPMESSIMLVMFGEALLFESSAILLYMAFSFLLLYIRQVLIEEPSLRRRFGKPYEDYCNSVPRWIPRLTAYTRKN